MDRKIVSLVFVSVLLLSAFRGTGFVEGGVDVASSGDSGQRVLSGSGAAASEQGAWTQMASLPYPVDVGGSLAYAGGDHIYAFRGGGTPMFWRYSISANSWTQMANLLMTVGPGGALAWAGGDYIFAFSGGGTPVFWRYSISANSWTQMANLPTAVSHGGSLIWDSGKYIFAFGGGGHSYVLEVYGR